MIPLTFWLCPRWVADTPNRRFTYTCLLFGCRPAATHLLYLWPILGTGAKTSRLLTSRERLCGKIIRRLNCVKHMSITTRATGTGTHLGLRSNRLFEFISISCTTLGQTSANDSLFVVPVGAGHWLTSQEPSASMISRRAP